MMTQPSPHRSPASEAQQRADAPAPEREKRNETEEGWPPGASGYAEAGTRVARRFIAHDMSIYAAGLDLEDIPAVYLFTGAHDDYHTPTDDSRRIDYAGLQSAATVNPDHADTLRRILARLEASSSPTDMDLPGYRLHPLKGEYQDFYAVEVSGNWRVVFQFEGEHATDVDYVDYH